MNPRTHPRACWWLEHFVDVYTAVAVTFLVVAVVYLLVTA